MHAIPWSFHSFRFDILKSGMYDVSFLRISKCMSIPLDKCVQTGWWLQDLTSLYFFILKIRFGLKLVRVGRQSTGGSFSGILSVIQQD